MLMFSFPMTAILKLQIAVTGWACSLLGRGKLHWKKEKKESKYRDRRYSSGHSGGLKDYISSRNTSK